MVTLCSIPFQVLVTIREVAGDRVSEHGLELVERIGLGEDGVSQGAGFVSAFRRFLNGEDDFGRRHYVSPSFDYTLLGER